MRSIALAMADGRTIAEDVRVADSFLWRSVGLLGRRALGSQEGLLLIPGGSVHTLGLRFSIDVVFLDRRMRVVSVAPDLAPQRFRVGPRRTARVLQLSAGRIESLGLLSGMYVLVRDEPDDAVVPRPAPHARPAALCQLPTIQFTLKLPPQRCARVQSNLGCGTAVNHTPSSFPRRRESIRKQETDGSPPSRG